MLKIPKDKYLTLKCEKKKKIEEEEQHHGNKSLGVSCSLDEQFVLQRQELGMWVLQENGIS